MLRMIKLRGFGERRALTPPAKKERAKTPWSAVSLVPGERACAAVKYLAKKRWLSADAPRFPVDRCNLATCTCRYQHHADRRALLRRGSDRQGLPRGYQGEERRLNKRERRRPQDTDK
jgi:hypothetical protein